jgi:hypothetical protein
LFKHTLHRFEKFGFDPDLYKIPEEKPETLATKIIKLRKKRASNTSLSNLNKCPIIRYDTVKRNLDEMLEKLRHKK